VGRRSGAALVTLAALASLLGGCRQAAAARPTVAILRAVHGTDGEQSFFAALGRAGYARGALRVLGEDAAEVHPDRDDAIRAVKGWVADGARLILALSTSSAKAAMAATTTVPILVLSNDPTVSGLVTDERHPDGNVTGSSYRVPSDRLLAVAADAFGGVAEVGCLYPSDDPAARPPRLDLVRGAQALGMKLRCAPFRTPDDAALAVQDLVTAKVDLVYLVTAPGTVQASSQIERALSGVSIPVVASSPIDFATLRLEPDGQDLYRRLGRQAARLLAGAKVSEVPIQDPGRFQLVVNQAVARRIGVTIGPEVLHQADLVIR
jgi:putative ABC transport system substrate-binding protein